MSELANRLKSVYAQSLLYMAKIVKFIKSLTWHFTVKGLNSNFYTALSSNFLARAIYLQAANCVVTENAKIDINVTYFS